jgi:hypothetical protein
MSQEHCWECEESYCRDEVFDIPVFKKGDTVKWCLNCAMKQLQWTDYRLVPKPKSYKNFKIKSIEDDGKEWKNIMNELVLCFEEQFRKLEEVDYTWGDLHNLATEIQYQEEPEPSRLTGGKDGK